MDLTSGDVTAPPMEQLGCTSHENRLSSRLVAMELSRSLASTQVNAAGPTPPPKCRRPSPRPRTRSDRQRRRHRGWGGRCDQGDEQLPDVGQDPGADVAGSLDVVTNDGQRIQLDGTTYKIRRPGFVIDYNSDIKSRRFIYDGKTFTVYSPKLGSITQRARPRHQPRSAGHDLQQVRDHAAAGRPVPVGRRAPMRLGIQALKSAYEVGTATIDGVPTDHFAFREGDVDWEVWIQKGDQPLPRKLVIVDRTDPRGRPSPLA